MSLVMTAWDKSWGVAVCEGRAVAIENGAKVPVAEDHPKLSRLPDGSVLGITGGFRKGHARTSLCGAVTEPLRRDIHAKAETRGFSELCVTIPELLSEYGAKHPELGFGVSLLGTHAGVVQGAAWSSGGGAYMPTDTDHVHGSVLGLTDAINQEATDAMRLHFNSTDRRYLDAATPLALEQIIRDLAGRHVELNDRIHVETVLAPATTTDGFCLNTLEPKEAGANVTANHVLTSSVNQSMAAAISTSGFGPISGLGWTVNAQSSSDVYNIQAVLILLATSYSSAEIQLRVDGAAVKQDMTFSLAGSGLPMYVPFIASITGLSAGSHTLQFYGYANGSVNIEALSYAMCQRVY